MSGQHASERADLVVEDAATAIGRAFRSVLDVRDCAAALRLLEDTDVAVRAAVARHYGEATTLGLDLVARERGLDCAISEAAEVVARALRFTLDRHGARTARQLLVDANDALIAAISHAGGSTSGDLH